MISKHIATSLNPALLGLDALGVWDTELAFAHLQAKGEADTKRTAERRLNSLGLHPKELNENGLLDELDRLPNQRVLAWSIEQARKRRDKVLFAQLSPLPGGQPCLHANDARGARFWIPLASLDSAAIQAALHALRQHVGKPIALFPHGALVAQLRGTPSLPEIDYGLHAYRPAPPVALTLPGTEPPKKLSSTHLRRLEAESIHLIREATAEARNPVMLYAMGKDSSVMLHLARKAFYPAPPPFPLLHIDTRWEFQEMYAFRDCIARKSGMDLLVHTNPESIEKNINPLDHGSTLYTSISETEALKQALNHYQFDMALGGARRDEELSRSKERMLSVRTADHRWDPKNQRPELWNLYNTRKSPGECMRAYPLSNWTELDIWQYIYQESIPVVPLYFARPRPVIVRPEMIMLVDDDRCQILPGEEIQLKKVRFRSLGCYPLTGAVASDAETLEEVLLEVINAHGPERQSHKIGSGGADSMEMRKQEGYF